jgi:hypothetical protein
MLLLKERKGGILTKLLVFLVIVSLIVYLYLKIGYQFRHLVEIKLALRYALGVGTAGGSDAQIKQAILQRLKEGSCKEKVTEEDIIIKRFKDKETWEENIRITLNYRFKIELPYINKTFLLTFTEEGKKLL